MIENYGDHAANERTFLAWVRTALAFMGFGLLVERFDLFVHSLAALSPEVPVHSSSLASTAGLVLIFLGILVLAISSQRYLRFKGAIASAERRDFRSSRTDLALVVIVATIGIFMTVYVAARVLG